MRREATALIIAWHCRHYFALDLPGTCLGGAIAPVSHGQPISRSLPGASCRLRIIEAEYLYYHLDAMLGASAILASSAFYHRHRRYFMILRDTGGRAYRYGRLSRACRRHHLR